MPIEPVAVAVVDTTGAGDAFAGTLATELSWGTDLVTAVRRANLAGAAAVQRPGARDATGVGVDTAQLLRPGTAERRLQIGT